MLIHKGSNYTILKKGNELEKNDGSSTRVMTFYPERDAEAIAGEIDELSAWQIFADISAQAKSLNTPISPDHILIDSRRFVLSEWSSSHNPRFTAPEGYSSSWALGASVFYIFLGCHVFQGLGGKGQTKTAPIPTLRRELPELSGIIARCLDFDASKRPTLDEILTIAEKNIARCAATRQDFPPLRTVATETSEGYDIDSYWPEKMT